MERPGEGGIAIGGNVANSDIIIGTGNTINRTEHHYHSGPVERPVRKIPLTLPYLVDRARQTRAIEEALRAATPNRSAPLLFVLFGDEKQAHEMLLKRIEDDILPGLLSTRSREAGINRIDVRWPEDIEGPDQLPDELLRSLDDTLRDEQTGHRMRTVDEVNDVLRRDPRPAMLTWDIIDDDWKCFGPACVSSFLGFWEDWPELSGRQRLLVFLSVKYVIPEASESSFLHRLLYPWLGWSKRATHEEIESVLEEQCEKRWERVHVRLLDKLDDIDKREATNWARSPEVRKFGAIGELLTTEIGKFFRQWAAEKRRDCVPMDHLAAQLITLLKDDSFVNR